MHAESTRSHMLAIDSFRERWNYTRSKYHTRKEAENTLLCKINLSSDDRQMWTEENELPDVVVWFLVTRLPYTVWNHVTHKTNKRVHS